MDAATIDYIRAHPPSLHDWPMADPFANELRGPFREQLAAASCTTDTPEQRAQAVVNAMALDDMTGGQFTDEDALAGFTVALVEFCRSRGIKPEDWVEETADAAQRAVFGDGTTR
jgi:hypothetical protein